MSDTEPPGRPRRALEPLDDGPDDSAPDSTEEAVPSGRSRRAWAPDDEPAGWAPADPRVTTPIPPPVPALPEPLQPPEAGRRFSAEPVADDWVDRAPRRSAASVSSPPAPVDAEQPSEEEIAAAVVPPDAAAGQPKRRLLAIIAGAVAIVLILGLILYVTAQRSGTTGSPPSANQGTPSASASASASPAPVLDETQLLAATDLTGLRRSTTWAQADATATPGADPACLELSSTGGVPVAAELGRRFTADQAGGTFTHVVQVLDTPDAATTAADALVSQLAACTGAHILSAYRLDGLADAATALIAELADGTTHTMVLARTGRFVDVADAAVTAAPRVGVTALARALASALTKQCANAGGTCPTTVKAVAVPPPATEPVGWLAWVDLPQITPGAGSWTASDPQAPKIVGSQCEVVDLAKLPGADKSLHRTYLVTDDPKAPKSFGVDQAVYTFGRASEATAMAKTLNRNFTDCGDRTRTATVTDATVEAPGATGRTITGTTYQVTQRISAAKTVTFRVGVAAAGTRLVYLFANPSATFDFTQNAWDALLARAAQRATQFL